MFDSVTGGTLGQKRLQAGFDNRLAGIFVNMER